MLVGIVAAFGAVILGIPGQGAPTPQGKQKSSTTAADTKASADAGRALFESTCAACHGLDGRGGERGPDIATRQQVAQLSDAQTLAVLQNGRIAAGMPGFGSLGAVKLTELLAYLRVLQGKGQTAAIPGDPTKGKSLFFGKACCSECHMVHGEGGFLGRELTSYATAHPPGEIRNSITEPRDREDHANHMVTVTLRDASKVTGVIRNEDNFSIQLQSQDGTFHFVSRTDIQDMNVLSDPIMPSDYGKRLTPGELDDLVNYLVKEAGGKVTAKREPDVEE